MVAVRLQPGGWDGRYFQRFMNSMVAGSMSSGFEALRSAGHLERPEARRARRWEALDLVLGICDRIHRVRGALHPQDRAPRAVRTSVQAVTVMQVDGAEPETLTPRITGEVRLVGHLPNTSWAPTSPLPSAMLAG